MSGKKALNIRMTIPRDSKLYDMLSKVKEEKGITQTTEAIRYCIITVYDSLLKEK